MSSNDPPINRVSRRSRGPEPPSPRRRAPIRPRLAAPFKDQGKVAGEIDHEGSRDRKREHATRWARFLNGGFSHPVHPVDPVKKSGHLFFFVSFVPSW